MLFLRILSHRTFNKKGEEMKKINYKELLEEAKRKEISIYILVKRKLNYRKASGIEGLCKYCKSLNKETIESDPHTDSRYYNCQSAQCIVIGEGFNLYSRVNLKYTCDNYNK